MINFSSLDEAFKEERFIPNNLQFIYYLFFDKGISIAEVEELPIPYIFEMIMVHMYVKEEESKAMKRK